MINNQANKLIEYLTPTLIFSYFFIHNIILVLIGIIFSLYLINIDHINQIIRPLSQALINTKETKDLEEDYKPLASNINQNDLNKQDSALTLVDTIEELGFIPSIDESDAA